MYTSREVGHLFRKSYDDRQRFLQNEETKIINNEWKEKFETETNTLKSRIEHLEFRERLITNKYVTSEKMCSELATQLKVSNDQIKELEKFMKHKGGGHRGTVHAGHGGGHARLGGNHSFSTSPSHNEIGANENSSALGGKVNGMHSPLQLENPSSTTATTQQGQGGIQSQNQDTSEGSNSNNNEIGHRDPLGNESYSNIQVAISPHSGDRKGITRMSGTSKDAKLGQGQGNTNNNKSEHTSLSAAATTTGSSAVTSTGGAGTQTGAGAAGKDSKAPANANKNNSRNTSPAPSRPISATSIRTSRPSSATTSRPSSAGMRNNTTSAKGSTVKVMTPAAVAATAKSSKKPALVTVEASEASGADDTTATGEIGENETESTVLGSPSQSIHASRSHLSHQASHDEDEEEGLEESTSILKGEESSSTNGGDIEGGENEEDELIVINQSQSLVSEATIPVVTTIAGVAQRIGKNSLDSEGSVISSDGGVSGSGSVKLNNNNGNCNATEEEAKDKEDHDLIPKRENVVFDVGEQAGIENFKDEDDDDRSVQSVHEALQKALNPVPSPARSNSDESHSNNNHSHHSASSQPNSPIMLKTSHSDDGSNSEIDVAGSAESSCSESSGAGLSGSSSSNAGSSTGNAADDSNNDRNTGIFTEHHRKQQDQLIISHTNLQAEKAEVHRLKAQVDMLESQVAKMQKQLMDTVATDNVMTDAERERETINHSPLTVISHESLEFDNSQINIGILGSQIAFQSENLDGLGVGTNANANGDGDDDDYNQLGLGLDSPVGGNNGINDDKEGGEGAHNDYIERESKPFQISRRTSERAADEALSATASRDGKRDSRDTTQLHSQQQQQQQQQAITTSLTGTLTSPNMEALLVAPVLSPGSASANQSPLVSPSASPLGSPQGLRALGGNFSVLSVTGLGGGGRDGSNTSGVISQKEGSQKDAFPHTVNMVSFQGHIHGHEHSNSRGGYEGAQGSLDLLSEYGLGGGSLSRNIDTTNTVENTPTNTSTNQHLQEALNQVLRLDHNRQENIGELDINTLNRGNQKKLTKLIEKYEKIINEFKEKVLSLEFQNTQLSDKLRSRSNEKEHIDKLHALQILERGVLLKELSKQVSDLKARLAFEKRSNKNNNLTTSAVALQRTAVGNLPPPDVNIRKTTIENGQRAKTPVALSHGTVMDENLSKAKNDANNNSSSASAAISYSRMLAASASMPILAADYGSFKSQSGVNVRVDTRDTADTNYQNNGRITSPYSTSRGKNISKGQINFLPDLVPNENRVTRDVTALLEIGYRNGNVQGDRGVERSDNPNAKDQLQGVRQQIVSILSERYPPPSPEQLLAVTKAKKRSDAKREMELKAAALKKEADAAAHAAIRARAKPKIIREDDDW